MVDLEEDLAIVSDWGGKVGNVLMVPVDPIRSAPMRTLMDVLTNFCEYLER